MSQRSEIIRIFNELIAQAKKISDLPAAGSVAGGDLVEVSIGGVSHKATASQIGSGGSGIVQTIVAGTNITVDATDPANPIVSSTAASGLLPLNPQTGAYQLLAADIDFTVGMNSGSAQNLTVPLNATESIPVGSAFSILQVGSAAFTLVPESGAVTVNVPSGASLDSGGQGTFIYLLKTGTNTWYATGTQGSGGGGSGTVTSVSFTGGLITVATATTTPALTVAGTSGGIPYFSSASTWATSAALAANALVVGGGAGAAPATVTTGAGVLTFLGTPSWTNFSSMITGTSPFWGLTGTSTLTGTTVIANGGNSLTFSGAAQFIINNTVTSGFNVTGSFTAAAASGFLHDFQGTITGRGTSNDAIIGTVFRSTLTNSTGVAVNQAGVRIFPVFSGSVVSGPLQTSLQVLAGSSNTGTRILNLSNNSGTNRFTFTADGLMTFLQVAQGSTIGGSVVSTTNGGSVIDFTHTLGLPTAAGGTVGRFNITGGPITNNTGTIYNTISNTEAHTVSHTTYTSAFIRYNPTFGGAQAGTQTEYFIIGNSGLSGFGILTPTARLQTRGADNGVAFLAEDDAGNAIASFGEGGGARQIGFFGATPVGQQTMGSATAGGTYGATEQTMLQAVYDAVRNIGIGT